MVNRGPRLVEAKLVFQAVPRNGTVDHQQFAIRVCKSEGKLDLTFDLHGEHGAIENLPPDLLDAIKAALEAVRARFTVEEFHEQVE